MTLLQQIAAIVGSVAAIVGGGVWLVKYISYRFTKTPQEEKEAIDAAVFKEQQDLQNSGRPKW